MELKKTSRYVPRLEGMKALKTKRKEFVARARDSGSAAATTRFGFCRRRNCERHYTDYTVTSGARPVGPKFITFWTLVGGMKHLGFFAVSGGWGGAQGARQFRRRGK